MDGRKNNGGTKGNKGGRKPKEEEQKLVERLSPLDNLAFKELKKAMEKGHNWAIKIFFDYRYGKPKERIDHTTDGDKINLPVISFVKREE